MINKIGIGTPVVAEITSRLTDEIRETIVGTYQGNENEYALILQDDGRMRHVPYWLVETIAEHEKIVAQRIAYANAPAPELVQCACGHRVPRSQVMHASMGTSCPDCYDKMSD